MSRQLLWVSPELVDQILLVAESEELVETCGVVTPDSQVMRLPNVSSSPANSYEIRSEDLVNALVDYCRRANVELRDIDCQDVIIWHTHPNGLIGPSRRDMQYKVNGFRYVVITLPTREVIQF